MDVWRRGIFRVDAFTDPPALERVEGDFLGLTLPRMRQPLIPSYLILEKTRMLWTNGEYLVIARIGIHLCSVRWVLLNSYTTDGAISTMYGPGTQEFDWEADRSGAPSNFMGLAQHDKILSVKNPHELDHIISKTHELWSRKNLGIHRLDGPAYIRHKTSEHYWYVRGKKLMGLGQNNVTAELIRDMIQAHPSLFVNYALVAEELGFFPKGLSQTISLADAFKNEMDTPR